MVREAASHAEEDKQQREMAEARNRGESLIYQTEKSLKDIGDKVPSDLKLEVENNIADLRTALNGSDTPPERLQDLANTLEQSTYKLSELLYNQTAGQSNGTSEEHPHEEGAPEENVVDAEFK